MPFTVSSIGFRSVAPPPLLANAPLAVWQLDGAEIEPLMFGVRLPQQIREDDLPADRKAVGVFVRGALVSFRVQFQATDGAVAGPATISAVNLDGGALTVPATVTNLVIDDGETDAVQVTLSQPLPNAIGRTQVRLGWRIQPNGALAAADAGDCILEFYTVDTQPLALDLGGFGQWRYLPVVDWACRFAAGVAGQENILNAMHAQLAQTQLQYGLIDPENQITTVQRMVQAGGGLCAVWACLLQGMAAWHGIPLTRRGYRLLWQNVGGPQTAWAASVVANNFGVGRNNYPGDAVPGPGGISLAPTAPYNDYGGAYPPVAVDPAVVLVQDRRYRFWSDLDHPNNGDGHMLTFFDRGDGWIVVYDPSFGVRAPMEMAMPPDHFTQQSGDAIAPFKAAYLDVAVHSLMGALQQDGVLFPVQPWTLVDQVGVNGITVRTTSIPANAITLIWNNS